jgi:hypothetical protein
MKNGALRFLHGYLVYSTPFAVIAMLDGQVWPRLIPLGNLGDDPFSTVIGSFFLLWLGALLVFLARVTWSAPYRSACFQGRTRGAHRRARGEVEFSLCAVGVQTSAGSTQMSLTLGHLDLVERSSYRDAVRQTDYYPVPVSKTAILAMILALQVLSFRYFSKKAASRNE